MLSRMHENWLLVDWACMKIDYLLAEHGQKLVTRWLSISGNWLLVGWAYGEIRFYWYLTMFFPLSPFPVPCLTSYVSCQVSVPCLPSSVPCLTSLFLVSHPLLHVSLFGSSPTKFGSAYAQSPRKCSIIETLAKIEGNNRNFFRKLTKGIQSFDQNNLLLGSL